MITQKIHIRHQKDYEPSKTTNFANHLEVLNKQYLYITCFSSVEKVLENSFFLWLSLPEKIVFLGIDSVWYNSRLHHDF